MMNRENPTRRPNEAGIMGVLAILLLVVMTFFVVADVVAYNDPILAPETPHINGGDYQTDVEFAVDGTVIKIYLDRLNKGKT